MKKQNTVFLMLVVIIAFLVLFIFDTGDTAPAYSAISTNETGSSLLYDTLRYMGHPVQLSRRPLTTATNPQHVYIIIQPYAPNVNSERGEEILEWVSSGGRLIFLSSPSPNIMDRIAPGEGRSLHGFISHRIGMGELIIGPAFPLLNASLMAQPQLGQGIEYILREWNAPQIFFAAYYHGMEQGETFLGRLPFIVQLIFAQLAILGVFAVWHFGKRFGKAMPFYEETEREENEHVRALARLLNKFHGRKK
ncbi:MAG: DUF4350 domain-containing protein [Defluviitaleaceae bacterium]|nr:DUF4350 domain-containing protein [Defluviitaleaceae bacterium]